MLSLLRETFGLLRLCLCLCRSHGSRATAARRTSTKSQGRWPRTTAPSPSRSPLQSPASRLSRCHRLGRGISHFCLIFPTIIVKGWHADRLPGTSDSTMDCISSLLGCRIQHIFTCPHRRFTIALVVISEAPVLPHRFGVGRVEQYQKAGGQTPPIYPRINFSIGLGPPPNQKTQPPQAPVSNAAPQQPAPSQVCLVRSAIR